MHSIGMIAVTVADSLGGITARLPWGWFSLLAIVDAALVAAVVSRRVGWRRVTAGTAPSRARPDALVLRSGWWVPRSRALTLPPHRATYAWPLHSEYMVRRLV